MYKSYGYSIDEKKQLQVIGFKTNNEEEMGNVILELNHQSKLDVRNEKTNRFKTIQDMMKFVNDKRKEATNNSGFYFGLRAYDMNNKGEITLYHTSHYSRA